MDVKYVLRGSMSEDSQGFLSRVSVNSPEAGTQESAAYFRLCLLRTAGEKDPNRRGPQEPPDNGEVWAPRASCTSLLTPVHTRRQEVYTDPQRRFVSTCALDGKKSRACLRVIKKFWGHRTLLLYLTPKTIAKFHSALWNTTNFDRTMQTWNANRTYTLELSGHGSYVTNFRFCPEKWWWGAQTCILSNSILSSHQEKGGSWKTCVFME